MSEAVPLVCPTCGAGVAEGARRCAHCEAPLATVRCASCFHMSSPDAVHCAGCGRDLGLEPIMRADPLLCPDCQVTMAAIDCGPGVVHDCGRCGGQFVEAAALRDLLERREPLDPRVAPARASAPAVEPRVHYVACPACRSLMNRRNFGGTSGVIVDVCAKHGTWFDPGELPRVLAFAESGGLARVRAREAEARARAVQARVAGATQVPRVSTRDDSGDATRLGGSIVSDLLAALFGE